MAPEIPNTDDKHDAELTSLQKRREEAEKRHVELLEKRNALLEESMRRFLAQPQYMPVYPPILLCQPQNSMLHMPTNDVQFDPTLSTLFGDNPGSATGNAVNKDFLKEKPTGAVDEKDELEGNEGNETENDEKKTTDDNETKLSMNGQKHEEGKTELKSGDSTQQKNVRFRVVINRWNESKSKWENVEMDDAEKEDKQNRDISWILRKNMDIENEKKLQSEELEIHSEELKKLIAECDKRFEDDIKEVSQPFTMESPSESFVWNWDRYETACKPQDNDTLAYKEARNDLKELMLQIKSSKERESYFRSRELLISSKKIKYENLWALFPHGAKVYARSFMNEMQMFEVTGWAQKQEKFTLYCCAFDWDGSKFSAYNYDFDIKNFSGEKLISSLEVFPTEFFSDSTGNCNEEQLRQQLIKRGQRFCEICTEKPSAFQFEYQGSAIIGTNGPHSLNITGLGEDRRLPLFGAREVDITSMDISGRQNPVIIDHYAFLKSRRNRLQYDDMPLLGKRVPEFDLYCPCGVCKTSLLQQWRPEPDLPLDEAAKKFSEDEGRLIFLPPRLLGFALKNRVWAQFLVDKLKPISFSDIKKQEEPFKEELQLEEDSKELLLAFVKNHKASRLRMSDPDTAATGAKVFDVIEGKGQGIAILLHGAPGVGKTLTAETIALATNRPLLAVSVAEIGLEAHEAERKLTEVFAEASRWEAVLLMDEADVFVEERLKGDLQRNALVSVLLRSLEYYNGIIILTTNRIRSLDAAMLSRINLAIHYDDLSPEQRTAIYLNRLKYIPDDEIEDRRALEKELQKKSCPLIKKSNKANGRQIRNIVVGALALAKSKGECLAIEHLIKVDETTSNFNESMSDLLQRQRMKNEVDGGNR